MSEPSRSSPVPAPAVVLDLVVDDPRWPAGGERLEAAARAALAAAGWSADGTLALVLADDPTVQALNREWRGKDRPTNVLSFPGDRDAWPGGPPPHLGDVILAYDTVMREAAEQAKAPLDHAVHLVVHGVLHLLGFDHETEVEAEVMEGLETRMLAGLGLPDPYRAAAGEPAA